MCVAATLSCYESPSQCRTLLVAAQVGLLCLADKSFLRLDNETDADTRPSPVIRASNASFLTNQTLSFIGGLKSQYRVVANPLVDDDTVDAWDVNRQPELFTDGRLGILHSSKSQKTKDQFILQHFCERAQLTPRACTNEIFSPVIKVLGGNPRFNVFNASEKRNYEGDISVLDLFSRRLDIALDNIRLTGVSADGLTLCNADYYNEGFGVSSDVRCGTLSRTKVTFNMGAKPGIGCERYSSQFECVGKMVMTNLTNYMNNTRGRRMALKSEVMIVRTKEFPNITMLYLMSATGENDALLAGLSVIGYSSTAVALNFYAVIGLLILTMIVHLYNKKNGWGNLSVPRLYIAETMTVMGGGSASSLLDAGENVYSGWGRLHNLENTNHIGLFPIKPLEKQMDIKTG
ncbi:hypothetical protein HK096_006709, partial [Nowakowskiella sp. JEL0078]